MIKSPNGKRFVAINEREVDLENAICINQHCQFNNPNPETSCDGERGGEPSIVNCKYALLVINKKDSHDPLSSTEIVGKVK